MKLMKTEDAVGQVLCHDITQIIKGVTKDAVFRKGHIITAEDIPVLLSVGKDHVYIWENDETKLHENDAAEILTFVFISKIRSMESESPISSETVLFPLEIRLTRSSVTALSALYGLVWI